MYRRLPEFAGRHVPHGWRSTFATIMNERADIGLVDLAWAVLDELRWVQPVQYHRELGAVPTQISAIMAHWMEERGIDPRTA